MEAQTLQKYLHLTVPTSMNFGGEAAPAVCSCQDPWPTLLQLWGVFLHSCGVGCQRKEQEQQQRSGNLIIFSNALEAISLLQCLQLEGMYPTLVECSSALPVVSPGLVPKLGWEGHHCLHKLQCVAPQHQSSWFFSGLLQGNGCLHKSLIDWVQTNHRSSD